MQLSARELMEKLISYPTVSRDSNLALIDFVEKYLTSHGVDSVRVPNEDGTKAALYAHVGPQIEGGVVLSGHTDVVPVDGQEWDTDPFVVTQKGDKLYGRGTCDMKGFDALALWAVPLAIKAGIKRPLQIALSYDEEVGCLGAPPMIDHMVANGLPRASTVLVGEPSMMKVVTAHKGGFGYNVHFQGFEVHSSIAYQGVNAIMMAAKLIDWANQVNADVQAQEPNETAKAFDPPYTSLHVGKISGGTAHNITAKDCHFAITWRMIPGEDPAVWESQFLAKVAELKAEMKAVRPEAGIHLDKYFTLPGLAPEVEGDAEGLARRLTGDNSTNVVSYGTEAGQFQERGYSGVVCGPGNIEQAHQPNEFISVAQFEAGQAFITRLIEELSA